PWASAQGPRPAPTSQPRASESAEHPPRLAVRLSGGHARRIRIGAEEPVHSARSPPAALR
ncbi:MAG: hypothetical protein KJZ70_18970, partial [Bryobacterales bacterium]|nr:hypothetical protein [Bryobacterales bacterium]